MPGCLMFSSCSVCTQLYSCRAVTCLHHVTFLSASEKSSVGIQFPTRIVRFITKTKRVKKTKRQLRNEIITQFWLLFHYYIINTLKNETLIFSDQAVCFLVNPSIIDFTDLFSKTTMNKAEDKNVKTKCASGESDCLKICVKIV